MELKKLNIPFSVCKTTTLEAVDLSRDFTFVSKTDDEISIVCPSEYVPADTVAAEHDWLALKIEGVLDFALIGIIAKIASILAENAISVFVISTYNTDYILMKEDKFEEAVSLLQKGGYTVV